MRRKVKNPRVILLDCPLEYKKGESQTNIEFTKDTDFTATLEEERKEVKALCDKLIALTPDVVITEKVASDLATHYLQKANVSVIRLLRKTDSNHLTKVTLL